MSCHDYRNESNDDRQGVQLSVVFKPKDFDDISIPHWIQRGTLSLVINVHAMA